MPWRRFWQTFKRELPCACIVTLAWGALLMLLANALPLAAGYLLKCYKFHKQGFGDAWDQGMREAFDILRQGRLGKRPFRLRDLPNYLLMEVWMIWNMIPYLWYRLVIVPFGLK